jgi:hypothetical protein
MGNDYQDFSFDSGDDGVGKKAKRFKGKEGETYRASFVWLEGDANGNVLLDGKVLFTGCERHYLPGVGYFLNKGPEFSKIAGGPPKQAVATIICVWPTSKNGKLNTEAFSNGEGFQVYAWTFAAERYQQIKRRHSEFSLNAHDMTLTCTDTQYQKMDLSPCKDNLFRKLMEMDSKKGKAIAAAIVDEVKEIAAKIREDMARDLSLEQIREKLGGANSSPVTGGAAASGENVDDLLDNLLDDDK